MCDGWRGTRQYRVPKRALDVAVAVLLLVLLWPFMLLLALAIRLESPGPVLYVQPRVGFGGKIFWMLKFRTMRRDRRVQSLPIHFPDRRRALKVRDDPRITRLGRLLRRSCLDELPQLINVIRGEMSLVGPRPELPEVVEHYRPIHYVRHTATPGVTGWWQIRGRSQRPDQCPLHQDLETKLADDLFYLTHRSLTLDIKILLLTVPVVLRGHGAT